MLGLFLGYLKIVFFSVWCLLAARFLLILAYLVIHQIREMTALRKLKKDKNFKKLFRFASKIKLKVTINFQKESSSLAYSKMIKNLFGKKTEVLLKDPFVVLGMKNRKNSEIIVVSLAHEIGHRLYWLNQLDKHGTYLESPEMFCPIKNAKCELIEELGGWEYAVRLLGDLKIGFDREKFFKVASMWFGTYLLASSNCLNQNCPKLFPILSNELTFRSFSLNEEENKWIIDYFNDVSETTQLPDLGKIFND